MSATDAASPDLTGLNAPGQVHTLSGKARLAGVLGWPVGHSLSPRLHGYWLARHGIDGVYVPLPVRPDDFAAALRVLLRVGFAGFNVTIPHKEAAFRACDRLDDAATRVGAVNTIVATPEGGLEGRNTDGYGFTESLRAAAPQSVAAGGAALVIGAGGAARAVADALLRMGFALRLANRTRERAQALAERLDVKAEIVPWTAREDALDGVGLLVNTTSLGMAGQPALGLDLARLSTSAVVVDTVYVPLETPLLKAARARGNRTVDGLGMLLHQGRPGFAAWFGVDPQVDEPLRRHVLAAVAKRT